MRFADMIPGCYDPVARAQRHGPDGVLASLWFPTLPRFGGALFLDVNDKELADAVRTRRGTTSCSTSGARPCPGLFIPMIDRPAVGPGRDGEEIRRCAAKGARGAVASSENPAPSSGSRRSTTDAWDPVWRAVDRERHRSCACTSGRRAALPQTAGRRADVVGDRDRLAASARSRRATDMMMSRGSTRVPDDQVRALRGRDRLGAVRAGASRLHVGASPVLDRASADDVPPVRGVPAQLLGLLHRRASSGSQMRDKIGVDKIMWECDYPHSDSTWPHSQEARAELLDGVPTDEVARITHQNAEALFRFCRLASLYPKWWGAATPKRSCRTRTGAAQRTGRRQWRPRR